MNKVNNIGDMNYECKPSKRTDIKARRTARRPIAFVLVLALVLTAFLACATIPANAAASGNAKAKKAAYLRQDVTVTYDGNVLSFYDEQGAPVNPLTLNGSTYLPVRAVSGLMGEPIEWVSLAKTVYIGRTISRPAKQLAEPGDSPYISTAAAISATGKMSPVTVYERSDILVMYDFEECIFKNEQGIRTYPINYKGSNYLPLRAIAELMKADINWNADTKTVSITSPQASTGSAVSTPGALNATTPAVSERAETKAIKALYESETEIYNLATIKIASISDWSKSESDAAAMAESISEDQHLASLNTAASHSLIRTETFNESEAAAADALNDFVEITEHYILVMENIAYLAAAGEDYSMLADTFLEFALATDEAMKAAAAAVSAL